MNGSHSKFKMDINMNKLLARLTLSTAFLATNVMAQEQGAQPKLNTETIELSQIFDEKQVENLQALELSNQEMKDTQGAYIWFAPAILGGARVALTGLTRHGVNQTISRNGVGVSNQAILNTMRNPTKAYSQISNQTTRYIGPQSTVVLNQNGRIVTTWGQPRITVTPR